MGEKIPQQLYDLMEQNGYPIFNYSPTFIGRRLQVRMRVFGVENYTDYLRHFSPDEAKALRNELLINVTQLFRDVSPFTAIAESVLPNLPTSPKIWSAGCSNGSEAATLAILCQEAGIEPQILGTDKDIRIIEQARTFTFDESFLRDMPPKYMKYFTENGKNHVLSPSLQRFIRFSQADILETEAPKSDFIVCRNTVIYFVEEIKKQLYLRIFDALPSGGFFMLGKTETLMGEARTKFQSINTAERIYLKP